MSCPNCNGIVDEAATQERCPHCGCDLTAIAKTICPVSTSAPGQVGIQRAGQSPADPLITWNCDQPIPGLLDPPGATNASRADLSDRDAQSEVFASVSFGPASPPWPDEASPMADAPTEVDILRTLASSQAPGNRNAAADDANLPANAGYSAALSDEQLVDMWREAHSPTTKPSTTIRKPEQISGSPRDSRLIITSRSVVPIQSPLRTSADYELIETIGEGGVGVVYAARQASIDRTVAVKMLKPASAQKPEQRDKFLSEAVVTGDLDHPNIVPIYDLGSNESGALFYAMKRVQGTPWVSVLPKKALSENLEILLKVADAVGFAHSRGVIHRDLKPENVMLGEYGEVLVMDWGLALVTPEFRKSRTISPSMSMGGTPAYMAPEMARGPVTRITRASDVYLLGAILYEIVTGHPPHTAKTINACLLAAARNEIHPPEQRSELIDIALRAMSTAPEDRYASVRDFQSAIRRFQAHSESIVLSSRAEADLAAAQQTGDYELFSRAVFAYQEAFALWDQNLVAKQGIALSKLAYATSASEKGDYDLAASLLDDADPRHRPLIEQVNLAQRDRALRQQRLKNVKRIAQGLAAAILIVVSGALIWVSNLYGVAENEAQIAIQQKRLANSERESAVKAKALAVQSQQEEEYAAYIAKIGLAAAKVEENAFGEVAQLLADCPPHLRNWEWGRLRFLCGRALRTFVTNGPVDSVVFDPTAPRFATGGWDGKVRIWSTDDSARPLLELEYGDPYVFCVAFSSDGQYLAAAGGDTKGGYVKIWTADTGRLVQVLRGHTDRVLSVCFNGDGSRLLTASCDGTAKLWDASTGEVLRTFSGHSWWVWSAAFSPSEDTIVTAGQDRKCIVWSLSATENPTPQQLRVFTGHEGPVYCAVFSPDGRSVISGGFDNRILIWSPDEAKPFEFEGISTATKAARPQFRALEGHGQAVRSIRLTQTEPLRILSASHDNTLKLWDYQTGELIQTFRGHSGWVRGCDVTSDAKLAVSSSKDHTAKLWTLEGYEEARVLNARVLSGHGDAITSASFSRDGHTILTSSRDRTARIWDFKTGKMVKSFSEGHEFLASSVILFGDARRFLTSGIDNTVRIWDLANGVEMAALTGTGGRGMVTLSPDDRLLLTANRDEAVLWDIATRQKLGTFSSGRGEVTALAFSHDSRSVFVGTATGRTTLWDASSGQVLWNKRAHSASINAVVFSPDGKRVLTASSDNTVGQFDVATGEDMIHESLKHDVPVTGIAITPDGKHVVTNAGDEKIRVWNLEERRIEHELASLAGLASNFSISPDGLRLVTVVPKPKTTADQQTTAARSAAVQFWNILSGEEIAEERMNQPLIWSAVFAPAEGQVILVGGDWAGLYPIGGDHPAMTFSPHTAVTSAHFSPDETHIITSGGDATAKVWDVATATARFKLPLAHEGAINSAVYSPDGRYVLTASDDCTVRLWAAANGTPVWTLQGEHAHAERVRSASFSPDGRYFITASDDKTARIWTTAGQPVMTLSGHKWPVTCAVFSPDGRRAVTGSDDMTARIWDVTSGKLIGELAGHTAAIGAVAYSPDGKRILTGSRDSSTKLWDAVTMKEILTLKGHTAEVTSASFSSDGRYALTASSDGTAIVWLTEEWRDRPNSDSGDLAKAR
jgi:WD40 repeat protein/serine/threonine protein kinase